MNKLLDYYLSNLNKVADYCPHCLKYTHCVKNGKTIEKLPFSSDEFKNEIIEIFEDKNIDYTIKNNEFVYKKSRFKCQLCEKSFSRHAPIYPCDYRKEILAMLLRSDLYNFGLINNFIGTYSKKVIQIEDLIYHQKMPKVDGFKQLAKIKDLDDTINEAKKNKNKKGIYIEFDEDNISKIMPVDFSQED